MRNTPEALERLLATNPKAYRARLRKLTRAERIAYTTHVHQLLTACGAPAYRALTRRRVREFMFGGKPLFPR